MKYPIDRNKLNEYFQKKNGKVVSSGACWRRSLQAAGKRETRCLSAQIHGRQEEKRK